MFKAIGIRTLNKSQLQRQAERFDAKCKTMKPKIVTGQDLVAKIRAKK